MVRVIKRDVQNWFWMMPEEMCITTDNGKTLA